jgi:ferredoxin--NADP+ reductase
MCGCCRLSIDGETKFACVDGPLFDASKVDFAEAVKRNKMYVKEEKLAADRQLQQTTKKGEEVLTDAS